MVTQYYDIASKDLCELKPNDTVRIEVQDQWVPGVVVKLTDAPRLYLVRGPNGREYHRNRKHLRRVEKASVADDDDERESIVQSEQVQVSIQLPTSTDTVPQESITTSRGQIVKEPTRYQDFVKL